MSGSLTHSPPNLGVPSFASITDERRDWRHWSRVAAASVVVHIFIGAGGVSAIRLAPDTFDAPRLQVSRNAQEATRLVAPPLTLTQKAPNRSAPTQEFDLASLPPRAARPNVPSAPGAAAAPRQFRAPEVPKRGLSSSALAEAPTLDVRASATPPPPLGIQMPPAPPPQIEPQEKPKLAFERPGVNSGTTGPAGVGRVVVPKPAGSVDETVRQMSRGGGRGLIVGDDEPGAGGGINSPSVPVPGRLGSAVELLSDPQGADFWPYLVRVLSTVRRNWFSVIPESARLGRQGRTVVQFAINRDGSVAKVVFASSSGAEALDRAAVAGISASNPFPPLPAEFKGSQARLQFVFKYNVR